MPALPRHARGGRSPRKYRPRRSKVAAPIVCLHQAALRLQDACQQSDSRPQPVQAPSSARRIVGGISCVRLRSPGAIHRLRQSRSTAEQVCALAKNRSEVPWVNTRLASWTGMVLATRFVCHPWRSPPLVSRGRFPPDARSHAPGSLVPPVAEKSRSLGSAGLAVGDLCDAGIEQLLPGDSR